MCGCTVPTCCRVEDSEVNLEETVVPAEDAEVAELPFEDAQKPPEGLNQLHVGSKSTWGL